MHAVETIQRLTSMDASFAEEVEQLRLSIRNWPLEGVQAGFKGASAGEETQPQV
jgi:hypothetical protein